MDKNGSTGRLPVLLSWKVLHSVESCDAVELTMPVVRGLDSLLHTASEIRCVHQGETVFCGIADEYELRADASGATAMLSGRGYGARLLDNEAESAEYWNAELSQILERHVYPCGIRNVRGGNMRCAGRFPVRSGQSHWHVLREFCFFAGGVIPRFDRYGTLLLTNEKRQKLRLSGAAITEQVWRDRRYGVFSHVLVKNTAAGQSALVKNPELIRRGGLCRRVINVPRYTQYDRMRHTGEYQISQSRRDSQVLFIKLPLLFSAFAGDCVDLQESPLGMSGSFTVAESCRTADGHGGSTRLKLVREE